MTRKTYNGHPSHAAWNVSLWMNNDEGIYNLARTCKRIARTADRAADLFMDRIGEEKTPDGVRWTKTNVKRAMGDI
jgi:hypothetical protein